MKYGYLAVFFISFLISTVSSQDDVYHGRFIGELNSHHHQVEGKIYAVDDRTLLFKDFTYDGASYDCFFWAGNSLQPGPRGFIIPNKYGRTNVLTKYSNEQFTLTLPDNKKIENLKWISVYDLTDQVSYGDVSIPPDFEPPSPFVLTSLSERGHGVRSEPVVVLDSKTIRIPKFSYDGLGKDTFFYVGIGPQPASKGTKVPDEYGYLNSLRSYYQEDVVLTLPGSLTVSDGVQWLSVYNIREKLNYGHVYIPDGLIVPPSLLQITNYSPRLPNCERLHKDLQVSWDVFGPQVTVELAAHIGDDEYVAFGTSGSQSVSTMLGGEAVVAYVKNNAGFVDDYNITGRAPCARTLGSNRGVCKDSTVGGLDNYQLIQQNQEDGITIIRYRRPVISPDPGDPEFNRGNTFIIWAIGKLNQRNEPMYHNVWPRGDVQLDFFRSPENHTCGPFLKQEQKHNGHWGPFLMYNPKNRNFTARLGPPGGRKGYLSITGMPPSGLVWYINGFMAPELWMRRGTAYTFYVEGGSDPHRPEYYHPFIITNEPYGGYGNLDREKRRNVKVLAGVSFTSRRRADVPEAAGRLCVWRHQFKDRHGDDDFDDFKKFRNSLRLDCEEGEMKRMIVKPNSTWPDVVYYHSYTHPNMGWRIHIVDSFSHIAPAPGSTVVSVPALMCILSGLLILLILGK